MVVVPLRESGDAWDLLRGSLAAYNSSFLLSRGVASSTAAHNGGPVLLFAASADPDALASVRTLTALLKADLIRYQVHPIDGYSQMRAKFRRLVSGDAAVVPRAVLCVNCAAMVDVQAVLQFADDDMEHVSDVRVVVIDSHRPYHLRNVNSDRIVLLHDSDDFNRAALPISLNLEDQWGNVPDERSDDDDDDDDDDSGSSSSSDDDDDDAGDQSASDVGDDNASDISNFIDDSNSRADTRDDAASTLSGEPTTGGEKDTENSRHTDGDSESVADHAPSSGGGTPTIPNSNGKSNEVEDGKLDDDMNGSDDGAAPAKTTDITEKDDDSEDEDMHIRKGTRKRRRMSTPAEEQKRRKRRRANRREQRTLERRQRRANGNDPEREEKRRLQAYYSNATVATSSACVSHGIAMLMRRANQDSVWMAILGVTSQYMTASIVDALYEDQMAFCREEVKVLQPNNADDGETSGVQNVGYVPSCKGLAIERIAQSVELRMDLLRHWSLLESLQNSSYTATRLVTWRQTGRRRLFELLATLGIPLAQSKEQWCYMAQKSKIALEKNLRDAISRFDLGDGIQYDSFVRTLPGHRGDISAADSVHAVTALLEVDDSRWGVYRSSSGLSAVDRFWRAYDALDSKRVRLLMDGVELAMFVQKLTADIGGDVIERRKFVPSGPFRYVFLRDEQHKEFLTQPILLRRLALFLNTALLRQGAKDKPFIILAPDVGRGVWIAVAAATCTQRNDFGQRFRKAAERNGSTVTYSGFDSSVCEIKDGQEIEFVRFLHDVM